MKTEKSGATKRSGAKKTAAGKAAKKSAAKPAPRARKVREPSEADIRLRAYFIAERRVQLALQGDPNKDWLEAKEQLMQEARDARA
ncbi:MAG: hypothetical protein ABR589_05940 [Chthoniobacterales bacterium]